MAQYELKPEPQLSGWAAGGITFASWASAPSVVTPARRVDNALTYAVRS
jgi:hypothetical protein